MVTIGEKKLDLSEIERILTGKELITIHTSIEERIKKNHDFLSYFSKDKLIYGINTGFGPMAQYRIDEKDQIDLQYNLIRSHSSGVGAVLPDMYLKAVMIARLNSLCQACSGIPFDVAALLKDLINNEIYPVIFEHGGVGASGDLVQLAHLALGLIGEGEVSSKNQIRPASEVYKEYKISPLKVSGREGLAIMNGTSCMTGIGLVNLIHAQNLIEWSTYASCMLNELVNSYDDHFSLELNQVKRHRGQLEIAERMRNILHDSKLTRNRQEELYKKKVEEYVLEDKVQEYYSLRCVPQILGPIKDTIKYAEEILINELNSANDNPVIDSIAENVFHGGNFHGDYISLEMDKLKIAITKLSMLAERQLNYLMNNKLNGKIPPFANLGKLGLNFGMQGVQFTATSTTAENQVLSNPMYVHSIPNNNDNQDIVSMGTNSALLTKKVIENTFEVISIEMMSILQGIDYLDIEGKLSGKTHKVYQALRKIFPRFENDLPKYGDIKKVKQYLIDNKPDSI
ncbi:HAL/PAL/TAL family ammonia-lyase [Sporocytophaga myxococcoides]|uniref:HAL/PAL/TAL family ammonia-lyase n=1 Tax=Sporocytophaga myxococcoides TaxID=153721 RepID=UPI000403CF6C|nr:aromatic amino acid ammonia-lyase [Sporocytophaga myxococcoides]